MQFTRRRLLVAGGAGTGLLVGWALWPRRDVGNLAPVSGETVLAAFLRIATDGRVTIAIPQAETGQGSWTALAQIVADELGADWRSVAVEPAPIGPLYANLVLADELAAGIAPAPLAPVAAAVARRWARAHRLMATAMSTSVRSFEQPLREAGATARALLCMAAAKRWAIDWRACDAKDGFVTRTPDRLRFGELAAEAATFAVPEIAPLRGIGDGGIAGRPLPRLDLAAKLDGSLRFAGDVRLPGMVFAAVRQAPYGSRLAAHDEAAAKALPDLFAVIADPLWLAAAADNRWAAERALDAMKPRFESDGANSDAAIDRALTDALKAEGDTVAGYGDPDPLLGTGAITADYIVGLAATAAIETPMATARITGDRVEIWAATQAPQATRAAIAVAMGFDEARVMLYPMPLGGGFGQGLDTRPAVQAAILAQKVGRPVQLTWSRTEAGLHDRFRPPARAMMAGRVGPGGTIAAWRARIATPASLAATFRDLYPGVPIGGEGLAVAGALPPYAIGACAIAHHPVDLPIATGVARGEAHGVTAFVTESFVDELAVAAALDPLSFRIALLGDEPRLAACLSAAATLGGWEGGGAGSGQGLACHAAYGSYVAVMAQVHADNGAIVVDRLSCVVDCGRTVNPALVHQQIEGGLLFALPAAIGPAIGIDAGAVEIPAIDGFGIPTLAAAPELRVRILPSRADPGGVSGLAVPPVAPAIANALVAATGHRSRRLPLSLAT